MRVVADTNILVSGLLWRGNPRRVLDVARDGILELFTSPALLEELEDVLGRETFAARLKEANVSARELVVGYRALASVIDAKKIEPVIIADPDDDAVLACAITGQCEVITSGDQHLLGLKAHQGIRILTATELLRELSLYGI
jgi:putative PIN family toxin of toxin-antitoxin system